MEREWIVAARTWELEEGAARAVHVGGRAIALWRVHGRIHALADRCPHQDASLGEEAIVDPEGRIVCTRHLTAFDPETGTAHGPLVEAGEGGLRLEVFPVRIEGDRVLVGV